MKLPDALPSLRGRRGTIVRRCYLALAVLVVLLTTGGNVSYVIVGLLDQPAAAHYGIALDSDGANRPIVSEAWPEASARGVTQDSRIVAIEGAALGPRDTQFEAGRRLRAAGAVLDLDLADATDKVSHHRIARIGEISGRTDPANGLTVFAHGAILFGESVVMSTFFLALSLLLFRRRPRDPEAILLAFGFLLLSLNDGYDVWLAEIGIRLPLAATNWLENSVGVIGFWCMLVGLCAFPDGRFVTRWSRFARLVPTTYVITNMATGFRLWQFRFADYLTDVPIFIIVVTSLILRYRRAPPGVERQQLKIAVFGGVVMVLAAVAAVVIDDATVASRITLGGHYVADHMLEDLKSAAFPIALLVSLLRYRLYDADAVISRSAGYAGLSLALVAIFACTEQLAQSLGQDYLGSRLGDFAGGLGAAAAAVMIAPLHRRIGDWTERRLRVSLAGLRQGLPLLVGDLREVSTPGTIAQAALEGVESGVRASHGAIVLGRDLLGIRDIDEGAVLTWLTTWTPPDGLAELDSDRHDAQFPMRVPLRADGIGMIGWMLLGPRPDGSFYGKDEREVLAEVAGPVARALSISVERQARETATAQEFARLRSDIDALREAVSRRDIRRH
jgi:hypothetical protein